MIEKNDGLPMSPAKPPIKKNNDDTSWRLALFIVGLPLVIGAMLWAASVLSDGTRVPAALAAAAQGSGVMFCTEGAIVRGTDSLIDRLFGDGSFHCTAWRMRRGQVNTATGVADWPSSPRR
jgi:hypothetical protein